MKPGDETINEVLASKFSLELAQVRGSLVGSRGEVEVLGQVKVLSLCRLCARARAPLNFRRERIDLSLRICRNPARCS